MFSSVPAEILGLVAGWGFLLIVAAFCFPIRSSYQKPIGKGKIVTAAAVSSIVLVLGIVSVMGESGAVISFVAHRNCST